MSVTAILGESAGVISFLAYGAYAISIFRGKTKPSRVTWWVLTFIGIMIFSSYYSVVDIANKHTIWLPFSYILGPLLIALLSIKYGERKKSRMNIWCGAISLSSLLLWGVFEYLDVRNSASIILSINVLADLVGLMPTIRKAILRPNTESRSGWIIGSIGSLLNLFAIGSWTVEVWIYPVYLLVANVLVTLVVLRVIRVPMIKGPNIDG